MKSLAFLLGITLSLVGCRPPEDALIIPGKRVGGIAIGRTNANEIGAEGKIADRYNDQGLGIGFAQNMRVASVNVTRANYKTKEGLSVGDPETAILRAYGSGERVTVPIMAGTEEKAILSDNAIHYPGIRWIIGRDGKVLSILVSSY